MKIRRIKTFEYNVVRSLMLLNLWWIGCKLFKNPMKSIKIIRSLITRFSKIMGSNKLVRAFYVDGKYYWDMFNPGWPSKGFNTFFKSHLIEEAIDVQPDNSYRRLLIAITKRCPLQCEHCSEIKTLYKKDVLTLNQYQDKIDKFIKNGVGQLVYSGGEPISRLDDLISLIGRYKGKCDQWIYTSAFGLNMDVAKKLKQAGLNGAAISLDHHLESEHNKFRGNSKSYLWALQGIKNLQEVGILVSLNVCPTKDYVDSNGVEEIIKLAKNLNIPIVNILEPRAVGNYEGKDVEYLPEHINKIRHISSKYNFNSKFFNYPTVLFPAGYRDKIPCGGGKSYLLLDYDGTLYPCPFCKVKMPDLKSSETLCQAD